jgi:heme/copper-type cytochrome/quinol oxidase subunit 3
MVLADAQGRIPASADRTLGGKVNRRELNVAGLPTIVFGQRSLIWWGTAGLMAIEGTMFAIIIAAYFFLRTRTSDWPPGVMPPAVLYGCINTGLFIISIVPNQLAKKAAERGERRATLLWLGVIVGTGVINLVLRGFEFASLNCYWYANAYASVVWTLLGLHTVHLVTDWFDSVVLAALFVTGPFDSKRFMDASENADYWYFVVFTWLPIWFVIYWVPRIL